MKTAKVLLRGEEIEVQYEEVTKNGQFLAARLIAASIGEEISRAELYDVIRQLDNIAKKAYSEPTSGSSAQF